jgi:deoxyribonuclease-4
MLLGVHCSVAGGLENAFTEATALGIDAMQVFTRNQRQWKAKPVSKDEQDLFRKTMAGSKVKISFSHCSYLINLASEADENREKSITALADEVIRCEALGLSYCVLHPGAAGGQTPELALERIAEGLMTALEKAGSGKVMILLENTAGQGSSVGGPFENLKRINESTGSNRIGYCFDTCHAFAAGFDIRTEKGIKETMEHFDEILGLKNLKVFHLNDSKGDLGSHLDRHEHIGHGKLGKEPFKYIMNHFQDIPKVIETPKEDDWDTKNLALLRSFIKK